MSRKIVPKIHRLEHYYREVVEFDTSHDARHALSLLTSIFPDINVSFPDFNTAVINNVRNHLYTKITFKWRLTV